MNQQENEMSKKLPGQPWIKMRSNLWDDPRVATLCDELDVNEATIIGCLYYLWAVADQHSVDGFLASTSARTLDRKVDQKGFAQALIDIGWLEEVEGGLQVARFDEHNGASAKFRAQDAKRKAEARVTTALNNNAPEECKTPEKEACPDSVQKNMDKIQDLSTNSWTHSGQVSRNFGQSLELEKEKEKEEDIKESSPSALASPSNPKSVVTEKRETENQAKALAKTTKKGTQYYHVASMDLSNVKLPHGVTVDLFRDFLEVATQKTKGETSYSRVNSLAKTLRDKSHTHDCVAVIQHSINGGYPGLYFEDRFKAKRTPFNQAEVSQTMAKITHVADMVGLNQQSKNSESVAEYYRKKREAAQQA